LFPFAELSNVIGIYVVFTCPQNELWTLQNFSYIFISPPLKSS
jgi:hypothetical protein